MNPFDTLCKALTMDELDEFCLVIEAGGIWRTPPDTSHPSSILNSTFWWDESPQGEDYWVNVYYRLQEDER